MCYWWYWKMYTKLVGVFKYQIDLFSESRGSLLVLNKQATSKGNPSVPGGGSRKQTVAATLWGPYGLMDLITKFLSLNVVNWYSYLLHLAFVCWTMLSLLRTGSCAFSQTGKNWRSWGEGGEGAGIVTHTLGGSVDIFPHTLTPKQVNLQLQLWQIICPRSSWLGQHLWRFNVVRCLRGWFCNMME